MFEKLPQRPTIPWRQRMDGGDDMFTPKALAASDRALDAFLSELASLDQPATEATALPAVERVVRKFNELNDKFGSFVETSEREELCAYIDAALKSVGVTFPGDVTYQWREW
ncbi:MAG: hypothetical protein JNN27_17620 [Planctomycetes bacterium]|nr:hypothetical protein [Planctomycetota bacterium]